MRGKKIILGITGGIAAYKSAYLIRALVKEGAEVQVVMTRSEYEANTERIRSEYVIQEIILSKK